MSRSIQVKEEGHGDGERIKKSFLKIFNPKDRSISKELAISLILLILLFEGVLLAYLYIRQSRFLLQELNKKADDYSVNLSEVLVVPIWDFDDEQIGKIGEGFVQNDIIDEIQIMNPEGKILFQSKDKPSATNRIERSVDIRYQGQVIGFAKLFFSLDAYKKDLIWLRNAVFLILGGSLIVIFITTGILLRIFMRKPLDILYKGIGRVAKGDYSYTFEEVRYRELSEIANRVSEMASEIQIRESTLHAVNRELQQEVIERRRTEVALQESEMKFRAVADSSPTAISILRKDQYLYVNSAWEHLTGYSKKDARTLSPLMVVHPDMRELARKRAEDRTKGEQVISRYEMKGITKSGEVKWLDFSAIVIEFDGEPAVLTAANDITERKQAEKALRESEEKYRNILENIDDGYFEVDIAGNFTFFNESMCKILGYSEDELMGMNNREFMDEEIAKKVYKVFNEVYRTGEPTKAIDWKLTRKNSSECFLETVVSLIKDSNDQPIGFRGIARDITDRKQLEEQLRQAHKMESIGTLAGGIAHDFNNILGIILGNTELAMDDVPEWNPAKFNLKEILTASLRAKDVVRQLLSFARKTSLVKKPTNVIPIIEESLKLLRSSIPTNIEIRHSIPKNIDTILADPTQINQVLINLFTNANHAMPDGGIVEVTLKNVELNKDAAAKYSELNPERYVNLIISDTGHGISQEKIDRIFDPYFTTKEVGKGTGMGLAVVQGIVKEHNGLITVESELGKGTTFSIFFPVVAEEAVEETITDEQLPTGDERILFIDDEESIVKLGHQRLERLGYKVESETSPTEALAKFRSQPDKFDLVISDLTMPEMTGDRLVNEILKVRSDIPIILCTGFSEKVDEKKAKAIGAADYIEKPFNKNEFAFIVRKVLDRKR